MNRETTHVFLGLGGNEGQVFFLLNQAIKDLSQHKDVFSLKCSHFYETSPLEVETSLRFINAVCTFQTSLLPDEIFKITQTIEMKLGKVSKPKNASRPIDIDFLFYGEHTQVDQNLEIPHPSWKERLFVLIPLNDLTDEIFLKGKFGVERYLLQDFIQPLLIHSNQTVSILEKNPHLQ